MPSILFAIQHIWASGADGVFLSVLSLILKCSVFLKFLSLLFTTISFLFGGQWTFPLSKSKKMKHLGGNAEATACWEISTSCSYSFFSNFRFKQNRTIEISPFESNNMLNGTYNLNWYHLRYVLLILFVHCNNWCCWNQYQLKCVFPSFVSTCKFILTFIIFSQRFESWGPSIGEFFHSTKTTRVIEIYTKNNSKNYQWNL